MSYALKKYTPDHPRARLARSVERPLTSEKVIHSLTASKNKLLLVANLLRRPLPVLAASLERIASELEDDIQSLTRLSPK